MEEETGDGLGSMQDAGDGSGSTQDTGEGKPYWDFMHEKYHSQEAYNIGKDKTLYSQKW